MSYGRQMSWSANVLLGKFLSVSVGKCLGRQMSGPANVLTRSANVKSASVLIGKCPLWSPFVQCPMLVGKCPDREMSAPTTSAYLITSHRPLNQLPLIQAMVPPREMAYKVERTSYKKGIVGSSSWCVPAGSENLRLVFCFIKIRLIFLFWGAKFYDMHATAYSLQFIISFLL